MCPIGQTHCCVSDLIRSPDQSCRLDVLFDDATCGYLHIKAWKVSTSQQQSCQIVYPVCVSSSAHPSLSLQSEGDDIDVCLHPQATLPAQTAQKKVEKEERKEDQADSAIGPVEVGGELVAPSRFTFSAPMDNIVVRTFQFPIT